MRVLCSRVDERTGTKARNSPYDVSIHKQWFRFPNAPHLWVTFGEYPELGVDKRSGSDRISKSFLHWDWNVHGRGCGAYNARIFGGLVTRGSGEAGFLWCQLKHSAPRLGSSLGRGAIATSRERESMVAGA